MEQPPIGSPQRVPDPPAVPGAARFIAGVFGVAFGGIGVSVIAFLWGGDHDAPMFFRLVGSFIALVFVAFGGAALYGVITGRPLGAGHSSSPPASHRHHVDPPSSTVHPGTAGYRCPNCGAPLDGEADVSPMGDVKCAFCKTWFNVHGRRST